MKNLVFIHFLLCGIFFTPLSQSQESIAKDTTGVASGLFLNQDPFAVKLLFSSKELRKNYRENTYVLSKLFYKSTDATWDSLGIELRARGNYRRQNCYYLPLKMRMELQAAKGTAFEGVSGLKVVLPCLADQETDDYILKEYLAYKLYEIISPYHFQTRLANIEFTEEIGNRQRKHFLKGILIEDVDDLALRLKGREMKSSVHPLQQEPRSSLHNAIFQFLIGNTDYSTRQQHNEKLFFIKDQFISIPYDFDMSGLVNARYAFVANIQNMPNKITEVTERLYKGYIADEKLLEEVRQEFIGHKPEMLNKVESLRGLFRNQRQFLVAQQYVSDFFDILESDKKFNAYIATKGRRN